MDFKWKTYEEFVKSEGSEEAMSCLKTGWKGKQYRKLQNAKNQALLELAKKDPRFREAVQNEVKKRTA